jgi:hypothetical protein
MLAVSVLATRVLVNQDFIMQVVQWALGEIKKHVEFTRQCALAFACSSPLAYRSDLFPCQCAFTSPVGSLTLRHGYPFALALSDD